MLSIPNDILRALCVDYDLSTRDKIYLMSTCLTLKNQIRITSVCINWCHCANASSYFINDYRINNYVLQQKKFHNITNLNITYNSKIRDICHLTLLTELYAASSICKVTCFNNLTNLTKLDLSFRNDLDISALTQLVYLNINYSKIKQYNIKKLINLTTLKLRSNKYVNDIKHLTNLTHLNIACTPNIIGQDSIYNLTNLSTLKMFDNKYVTNIYHLTKLTYLDIGGTCCIDQVGIMNLHSLTKIKYNCNSKITSTTHLTNLKNI